LNTTVDPAGAVVGVAESVIETSVPGVTVTVAVCVNDPEVAVMVVVHVAVMLAEAVTTPALLTVAHAVSDEVQVALPVKFLVLPSS
jgi:hypothetical protein